jgi:hypothetical protein
MKVLWAVLSLAVLASGCAGRHIYYVSGCNERLAIPHKRQECRACVERPVPHEFMPDNPDGSRCVRR